MQTPKPTVKWGIIGLGKIAHQFTQALQRVDEASCYAVASRSPEKATSFKKQYGFQKSYGNYASLIKDPLVEVVYIATPHTQHYPLALACLEQGKAVLCEKPLAMSTKQVEALIAAAKANKSFLMEALWTRFLPHFLQAQQWVKSGKIGTVRKIIADFGFKAKYDPESRVFDKKLGGGAWLDVGIYPAFLATTFMGEPESIQAQASFAVTGADENCNAILSYPNGVAILSSSIAAHGPCEAHIVGDKGRIVIHTRWHQPSTASLFQQGHALVERYQQGHGNRNGYEYEIEEVHDCLAKGLQESERFSWKDSLSLTKTLERVRNVAGIFYEDEGV